ncbi:MAG: DUF4834 family protein [Prevotella sp.]
MLKGLFILLIAILVVVSVIVLLAINIVLRFLKRMRKMAAGELDEDEEYERLSTSRRQHQYTFRAGNTKRAKPNRKQQGFQQATTHDGKVIIDNRQPEERKRKIIDADEGEYVEFTEE